jgi:hypothetical protein
VDLRTSFHVLFVDLANDLRMGCKGRTAPGRAIRGHSSSLQFRTHRTVKNGDTPASQVLNQTRHCSIPLDILFEAPYQRHSAEEHEDASASECVHLADLPGECADVVKSDAAGKLLGDDGAEEESHTNARPQETCVDSMGMARKPVNAK